MRLKKKAAAEAYFQKELGKRIKAEIQRQGYKSSYDFWIEKAGDHISRATLNYILAGQTDPKITTVHRIAKLLGVKTAVLLDFE